jgi:hypothetical protein
VPVCAADAQRVEQGYEPPSRQVLVDGQRMPYWNAPASYAPWAGGYFGGYRGGYAGVGGGLLGGLLAGTLLGSALGGASYPQPVPVDYDPGYGGGADDGRLGDFGGGDFGGGDFGGGDFNN